MRFKPSIVKSRINLGISLEELLDIVANNFSLGEIIDFSIETTGYEELNIRTQTNTGVFLVKIFSKSKLESTIRDYIKGMLEFRRAGIPVPSLLSGTDGYLFKFVERSNATYLCVMNYFPGETFTSLTVDRDDIKRLVTYLTKIHGLSFGIGRNYDSWGTANLLQEFNDKSKYLSRENLDLIEPTINEYRDLRFDLFSRSIIHGDLQRTNVLRNSKRNYCILDLGCMDFSYPVIDLSIFIAHFCFDYASVNPLLNLVLYNEAVDSYLKRKNLTKAEIDSIPIFVRATYAIYLIAANYSLHNSDDSNDNQTKKWIEFSKSGLCIPERDLMLK